MGEDKAKIIETCRNGIDAIDREIFLLIKKREQLSREIGKAKRDQAIPDRDFSREKAVFERAMATAHELGLPVNFVTSMQKLIMEASLSRQEKDRIKNNFDNAPKSVLVIGGAGRLGKWLCHFFADSGHQISVLDLNHPGFNCPFKTTLDDTILDHDIIVIATPIRKSVEMLSHLRSFNLKKPVIFDVSSVKAPVQQALLDLKHDGVKVTSLHPMFGPSVELLFGKHVIRTSLGVKEADNVVNEIFRATSLQVVDMSIDEHDAVISILLSLSHVVNIIFVRALSCSNFDVNFLERFSSPTFSNLLTIAKKVYSENPHLYFEIQALNPHTNSAHEKLRDALSDVMASVLQCDEHQFVDLMMRGAHYLSGET